MKGRPENDPDNGLSDSRLLTGITVRGDGTRALFSACAYFTVGDTEWLPFVVNVDTPPAGTADFAQAPDITNIKCSAPALIHPDGMTVTFTADVADAKGLSNIDRVNLSLLVEGRKEPRWGVCLWSLPTGTRAAPACVTAAHTVMRQPVTGFSPSMR